MVRKRRLLPESYKMPPFDSRENVIRFAEGLARDVLTKDVDPRRIDTALRAAGVALTGFAQATQEKLLEAILTMEHGGMAVIMLQRIHTALAEGKRQPLPLSGLQTVPGGDGP
jgi:Fe-S-cluster formation regulator IscX/YfhJ